MPSADRPQGEVITDRLAAESSPAYAAFCVYRNQGPTRSLENAWREFVATRDTAAKRAAKRSTYWAAWSSKYRWVERCRRFDAEIESIKRDARAASLVLLEERRVKYELEDQDHVELIARELRALLLKAVAAPVTDVAQEKNETVNGRLTWTKTRVKGINLSAVATLARMTIAAAGVAINGVPKPKTKAEDKALHDVRNLVFRGTVEQ